MPSPRCQPLMGHTAATRLVVAASLVLESLAAAWAILYMFLTRQMIIIVGASLSEL